MTVAAPHASTTAAALADALEKQGAVRDLVAWVRAQPGDAASVFDACPRADWLLALAVRAGAPRTKLVAAAAACAREALSCYAEPPEAALPAVAAAEQFARGALDEAACVAAADAADERALLAPSPGIAAAIACAASAARAARDPEEAPTAAVLACEVAVHEAGDCAMTIALGYAQRKCADDVRRVLTWADIASLAAGRR